MQTIVKRGQKIILVGNLKALAKVEAALEVWNNIPLGTMA